MKGGKRMLWFKKNDTQTNTQTGNAETTKTATWVFRILSVLVAIILWFYVMTLESNNFEKTYSGLTPDIQGIEGQSLSALTSSTVEISITGEKTQLDGMGSESVKPYVLLPENAKKGEYILPVLVDDIPDNMTVSVKPEKVTVLVESTESRTIPLTRVAGNLDDSLLLYDFSVKEIKVTGSVSLLERLDHAELALSSQGSETNANTSYFGTIVLMDANGQIISDAYLKKSNDFATVEIKVMQSKELSLCILGKEGEAPEITYDVGSAQKITLRGEPSIIAALPDYLSLSLVNLSDIVAGSQEERHFTFTYENILSAVPENTTLIAIDGIKLADLKKDALPTVGMTVSMKNFITETSLTVPLSLATHTALTSSLSVTVDPKDTVEITLRGQEDKLSAITAKDLQLVLDMSGKTAKGWTNVPLLVSLKAGNEDLEVISTEHIVRVFMYAK